MKTLLRNVLLSLLATLCIVGTASYTQQAVSSPSATAQAQLAQAADDPYAEQIDMGVAYFREKAAEQLALVKDFLAVLATGDLEAAKAAYIEARPPYEQIEVLAASFEQEDSDIDARPYSFEQGEASPDFISFHRIEALLFRDGDVAAAIPYAEGLVASVESLIDKLNDPSNFNSSLNFEGIIGLATEIPAKKISSEEETWSDQSLLIFKNNWIGIYSQVQPFETVLSAEIMTDVDAAYKACMDAIAPFYPDGQVAAMPYSSLSTADRKRISEASYQFRNALIEAAESLGLA
ncbi:Iron uptake system component EfeO [Halomicronema hongdechloris C2206]|uniref:Iron uptake system component EfeO n=1 Tax=Halomicronema hongdechloris C2206 TaxID=1641165 RepID=A0A1Z3HNB7_9CYAN|nr:EfeM/EfeO family lipoprotein [Halomicronema hongdechloris]ASC71780.1 Iron uptake system component EfeO [Halomicronema hongdechloris C2206]